MSKINQTHQNQSSGPSHKTQKVTTPALQPLKPEQMLEAPESMRHDDVLAAQQQVGNQVVQRALDKKDNRKSVTDGQGNLRQDLASQIQQKRGSGSPLPDGLQKEAAAKLGRNFKDVRIHTDDTADTISRTISARAFTIGKDIFFKRGVFAPGTTAGRETLIHELTHVVQQGGKGAGGALKLGAPDTAHEKEADQMGKKHATSVSGPAPVAGSVQRELEEEELQMQSEEEEELLQMQGEEDELQMQADDDETFDSDAAVDEPAASDSDIDDDVMMQEDEEEIQMQAEEEELQMQADDDLAEEEPADAPEMSDDFSASDSDIDDDVMMQAEEEEIQMQEDEEEIQMQAEEEELQMQEDEEELQMQPDVAGVIQRHHEKDEDGKIIQHPGTDGQPATKPSAKVPPLDLSKAKGQDQTVPPLDLSKVKKKDQVVPSLDLSKAKGQDQTVPPLDLSKVKKKGQAVPPLDLSMAKGQDQTVPPLDLSKVKKKGQAVPPLDLPKAKGKDQTVPPLDLSKVKKKDQAVPPLDLSKAKGQDQTVPPLDLSKVKKKDQAVPPLDLSKAKGKDQTVPPLDLSKLSSAPQSAPQPQLSPEDAAKEKWKATLSDPKASKAEVEKAKEKLDKFHKGAVSDKDYKKFQSDRRTAMEASAKGGDDKAYERLKGEEEEEKAPGAWGKAWKSEIADPAKNMWKNAPTSLLKGLKSGIGGVAKTASSGLFAGANQFGLKKFTGKSIEFDDLFKGAKDDDEDKDGDKKKSGSGTDSIMEKYVAALEENKKLQQELAALKKT